MQKTINTQKDVIMALLSTGYNVPTRVLKRLGVSYTQRVAELRRDASDYTIFTNKTEDGDCYRLWKHESSDFSKCSNCSNSKCSKHSCRR